MSDISQNPLVKPSELPFGATPFNEIQEDHFLPAIQEGIRVAQENIARLKADSTSPNFKNTLLALEASTEQVDRASEVFFNLMNAHTSSRLQELAKEISPMLAGLASDILLDAELFERVEAVFQSQERGKLDKEDRRLLEKTYRDFVRNGAKLGDSDKKALRKIDETMSQLSPQFTENVLKQTNAFELVLTSEDDIEGLPESAKQAAKMRAEEKKKDGWLVNLTEPSFRPFLTFANNRELREKIWKAYMSRCLESEENNNKELVKQFVSLRAKRAKLLGYKTHAHFTLEERMASTPESVMKFLEELLGPSKRAGERDRKDLIDLRDEIHPDLKGQELKPWDLQYYSEKLKKKKLNFDDEDLRPYFRLENVVDGVFDIAGELYGLDFKERKDVPVYHEDVRVFEVLNRSNKSETIGLFYADFYPRDSKSGGAWMTNFGEQYQDGDRRIPPHVSIVCNLTKPTKDRPSLLDYREVQTIFHEFGHALHSLVSRCKRRSMSGTHVYWDFVELPSQLMENWTKKKESLDRFAKHYKTDETIPESLVRKIEELEKFQAGYASLRQLSFGLLDMAWHTLKEVPSESVEEFEKKATSRASFFDPIPGTCLSTAFLHIFPGGYSSGYYSYKWAELLEADVFSAFEEEGIFNPKTSKRFLDNILSRGNTDDPMELFKAFRGREPKMDALLERSGMASP